MTPKCIILIRKVQKNVKIYCRYFCICSICIIFVSNCRIKIFCMLTERLPFYFVLLNGNSAVGLTKEISDGDFVSTIGLCGFLICLEGEIRISHDGTIYKIADEWEANGIEKASLCFDPSDKYIEEQQAAEEEQAAE